MRAIAGPGLAPYLRGLTLPEPIPPGGGSPARRLPARRCDQLPMDSVAAASLPAGVRLELRGTAQAVEVFKQKAGLFKGALLASCINAHKDLSGRQDGREAIHGGGRGQLCTLPAKSKKPPGGGTQEYLPEGDNYITLQQIT